MHAIAIPSFAMQARSASVVHQLTPTSPLFNIPREVKNCESEAGFARLQARLRASGGVATADRVALRLRDHLSQPLSWLARALVKREMVHFTWQSRLFIPMFQFDSSDMSLRDGVCDALATLTPVFGEWELASWFAEPNTWLRGESPADLLGRDAQAVRDAARADWYVAAGC